MAVISLKRTGKERKPTDFFPGGRSRPVPLQKTIKRAPRTGSPGRPTVLTPELIAEFERLLPTLTYIETVGDLIGVHNMLWRQWIRQGRREAEWRAKDPKYTPNPMRDLEVEFYFAYRRGLAQFQQRNLTVIAEASTRSWPAAAWLQERRFPEQWGDQSRDIREIKQEINRLQKLLDAQVAGPQPLPAAAHQEPDAGTGAA